MSKTPNYIPIVVFLYDTLKEIQALEYSNANPNDILGEIFDKAECALGRSYQMEQDILRKQYLEGTK